MSATSPRLLALAPLLALACAETTEPPPPPPVTIDLSNLCTELAQADCDRLSACGLLAAPFDAAGCLLRQTQARCEPLRARLADAVARGEATFFELAAAGCRDHLAALGCERGADVDWLAEPACAAMIGGAAVEGASCTFASSCSAGLTCLPRGGCPGVCERLRGNNETCSASEPCEDGLFCATPAMRCRARVALGAPCELSVSGNPCEASAFCDRSQPGEARCAQARGRGTGCTTPYECAGGAACLAGLCSEGREGDTCEVTSDCVGLLRCSGGRCRAPAVADDICPDGPEICREGLGCLVQGSLRLCKPAAAAGEPCGEVGCWLGFCEAGTCVNARGDGEPCAGPAECLPGRSCEAGRCTAAPIDCTGR